MNFLPGTLRRTRRRAARRVRRRHAAAAAARARAPSTASRCSTACGPSICTLAGAGGIARRGRRRRAHRRRHAVRTAGSTAQDVTAMFRERADCRPGDTHPPARPTSRARICSTRRAASGSPPEAFHRAPQVQPRPQPKEDTHEPHSTAANSSKAPPASPPRPRCGAVRSSGSRTRRPSGATRPRRAPSCACCAGAASCRATSTHYMANVKKFTEKTASRCASTTKAGRTCARRRRWRPTPAPARTSSCRPTTTPTSIPDKLLDVTDVCEYLGKKYGGWYPVCEPYLRPDGKKWIGVPLGVAGVVHGLPREPRQGGRLRHASRRTPTAS